MSHRPARRRNCTVRVKNRPRHGYGLAAAALLSWLAYLGLVVLVGTGPALYLAGVLLGVVVGRALPPVRVTVGGRR